MHVSQHQPSTGPEDPPGGRRSLYVPVRRGPAGAVVRLWRTPVGTRTAVAFTSDRRLRAVLGPTQPWIRLSEAALRRMAEPLGAMHLTVDPLLTARPPAAWSVRDDPAAPASVEGAAAGAAPADPVPVPPAPPTVRAAAPDPLPPAPGSAPGMPPVTAPAGTEPPAPEHTPASTPATT